MLENQPVVRLRAKSLTHDFGAILFLCDTGASFNVINQRLLPENFQEVKVSALNPVGVSGTLLQCHGEVTLQLTISNGVAYNGNFAIISEVSYDAILGFPALRELGFTLLSDDPTRVILSECHTPRQQSSISV